ncbi:hypothetical protein BRD00_01875 [Halobacteriales archaeon QS_8_69_26]|nr:MAG: hypothetical protein BRD00_01875 [Halobacteriales archaeon QS_8_69_26]
MPTESDEETPTVPVVCSECETRTRVPLPDVAESIERHNEGLHDGEEHAEVDPELAEHLADIVAEEMGLV